MDYAQLKKDLEGLYITIPTLFHDEDLSINEEGIRTHIRFLKENGINKENAVLLAGGAAGDFSTMSFEERIRVASIVIDEAGNIPVAMGAQTTSTQELIRLSKEADRLGASFIQVSCPFYFNHTEDDFYGLTPSRPQIDTLLCKGRYLWIPKTCFCGQTRFSPNAPG